MSFPAKAGTNRLSKSGGRNDNHFSRSVPRSKSLESVFRNRIVCGSMKGDAMNRSVCLVLLAGFFAGGFACSVRAESRPNIVLIISDDHGFEDYGFMGHPKIATPHLDRLARESLTFKRGYTPVPLCRPSLATMITGLYPHQHGVTGNDPTLPDGITAPLARRNPKYSRYFDTTVESFAKRPNFVRDLTASGYVSLQTGKWWENNPIKTAGFSHAMTQGTGKGDRHGGAGLEIGRNGLQPIYDFIAEANDKPFLVWYAPMLPHAPHTPPTEILEKYLKLTDSEPVAKYWACVEWFDQSCGDLLNHLEAKGLRDNTIIMYVTDNGWIQDPSQANRAAFRSKLTPYEGGVRTPIMISWPGKLKPSMDSEHLASSIDLWPTLAALLGTNCPADLPGINLTDEAAVLTRAAIIGEQYSHNIADVEVPTRSLEHRWIIDGWSKLILPDPTNRPGEKAELYNLQSDPWEKTDLAEANLAQVAELSKKLDALWKPSLLLGETESAIKPSANSKRLKSKSGEPK